MQLGSLQLVSRAMLSPLDAVSDVGFRRVCSRLGAGFTWTEMIRAQALGRGNSSTLDLIDTFDEETPTGIQLMAKTPGDLRAAIEMIEKLAINGERPQFRNITAVDLNFGCPSPSIIREGAGPALLKRKKRLGELFNCLADWKSRTKLNIGAVGCKIRLGLNEYEMQNKVYLNAIEIAIRAELDYVTIHARHGAQRSSQAPFWETIAESKKFAGNNIKIIGNGDVFTADDANRMLEITGCDEVMIARGAIKDPWVFRQFLRKDRLEASSIEKTEMEEEYNKWALTTHSKSKYIDFHKENFKRIRGGVEAFKVPRNLHL